MEAGSPQVRGASTPAQRSFGTDRKAKEGGSRHIGSAVSCEGNLKRNKIPGRDSSTPRGKTKHPSSQYSEPSSSVGPDRTRRKRQCGSAPVGISALFFRSEEHTSELQSHSDLVCRLLLE